MGAAPFYSFRWHIAERAGLSPGSFYHYFDSKLDIFIAVHDHVQEKVYDKVVAGIAEIGKKIGDSVEVPAPGGGQGLDEAAEHRDERHEVDDDVHQDVGQDHPALDQEAGAGTENQGRQLGEQGLHERLQRIARGALQNLSKMNQNRRPSGASTERN